MKILRLVLCFTSILATLILVIAPAQAIPVTVTITGLGFSDGTLVFDFIDGGSPDNAVSITKSSLASQPSEIRAGDVEGSLDTTLTLRDSVFFTEFATHYSGIDQLTFQFDATANPPASGSLPDSFSLFLVRSDDLGQTLFRTTDPTGADALLQFSIDGSPDGQQSVYQDLTVGRPPVQIFVGVIPEPATFLLLAAFGLSVLIHKKCVSIS
jgi:hypothetical protein